MMVASICTLHQAGVGHGVKLMVKAINLIHCESYVRFYGFDLFIVKSY